MKKNLCIVCCYLIATVFLASCQYIEITEDAEADANVILRFSAFGQEDFTRAAVPLSDQLSRLSVAVFDADGQKVKSINQQSTTDGFGTVAMDLMEGTYNIVAIAHNGTEGNATITSVEKVTFASNKVTDTFAYFGELSVLDGSVIEKDLTMTRRVAMVRFTLTDADLSASQLKFYYTGGSSTFSPSSGYGCVNSKQTEYRSCLSTGDGGAVTIYEIYTFPHEETDDLKVTVTALDASGNAIGENTFESVPVQRNKITTWTGEMFNGLGGGTSSGVNTSFKVDIDWNGMINF